MGCAAALVHRLPHPGNAPNPLGCLGSLPRPCRPLPRVRTASIRKGCLRQPQTSVPAGERFSIPALVLICFGHLCLNLAGCAQGGLPPKRFDSLRREFLLSYGHEQILLLNALQRAKLLCKQDGTKPVFANLKVPPPIPMPGRLALPRAGAVDAALPLLRVRGWQCRAHVQEPVIRQSSRRGVCAGAFDALQAFHPLAGRARLQQPPLGELVLSAPVGWQAGWDRLAVWGSSFAAFVAQAKLNLIVDDISESDPKDIAYTFSGYAPLSCRLVEAAIQTGWGKAEDVMKLIPGPKVDYTQVRPAGHGTRCGPACSRGKRKALRFVKNWHAVLCTQAWDERGVPVAKPADGELLPPTSSSAPGRRRTVLVTFIGGVTYGEIASLRFIGKQHGIHVVIVTTQLINGSTLLETFLPDVLQLAAKRKQMLAPV